MGAGPITTTRAGRQHDRRRGPAAKRLGLLLVACVLLTATVACEWSADTRYVYPVFDTVQVTSNVSYRTTTDYLGNPITLRLDIYRPQGDTATNRPAIMWMHGGGWVSGNKSNMAGIATDSAKRGYVGVSIQYRLRNTLSDSAAYDAYDDSVAAVEWLKANATTYGIDPTAIIAGGYSAGAINAMHLLYLPGTRGPATSPVAGAISVAGFSFVGPPAGRPPAIMFHGTSDTTVQYSWAQNTCANSVTAGNVCELITYEGGTHSIMSTQSTDIRNQSAHLVWERVLWASGRQPETVP